MRLCCWKSLTALLVDSAEWLFVDDLCLRVIPGAAEFQQASEASITFRTVILHCIYAYVHSSWWWTISKQLHICAGSFVSLLRVSFLWLICCVELSNPQRHVASLFLQYSPFPLRFVDMEQVLAHWELDLGWAGFCVFPDGRILSALPIHCDSSRAYGVYDQSPSPPWYQLSGSPEL